MRDLNQKRCKKREDVAQKLKKETESVKFRPHEVHECRREESREHQEAERRS
jgi:hypothetical protein